MKKEKEHKNEIKRYLFYINFLIKQNDKLKDIINKNKKLTNQLKTINK